MVAGDCSATEGESGRPKHMESKSTIQWFSGRDPYSCAGCIDIYDYYIFFLD